MGVVTILKQVDLFRELSLKNNYSKSGKSIAEEEIFTAGTYRFVSKVNPPIKCILSAEDRLKLLKSKIITAINNQCFIWVAVKLLAK